MPAELHLILKHNTYSVCNPQRMCDPKGQYIQWRFNAKQETREYSSMLHPASPKISDTEYFRTPAGDMMLMDLSEMLLLGNLNIAP